MSKGIKLIADERKRQIEVEGYDEVIIPTDTIATSSIPAPGDFITVRITSAMENDLFGEITN